MYTSPPLLRQSFVPWKGWGEAQGPSHLAQCSSVQSGDAARGGSSTSLQDFYSRVSSTSRARVSPLSVDLLCCTQQPRKKGWRSLPDVGEHLPPAPAAIPRFYNALRKAFFSVWWSGGWANRATRQQRAHHPNVLSQLCLKWDIPTFLLINCRTLQRDGKEMWSLLCGVNHHGV